jgi:hypothetical protein
LTEVKADLEKRVDVILKVFLFGSKETLVGGFIEETFVDINKVVHVFGSFLV